jgi:pilus assembly protein CpaE
MFQGVSMGDVTDSPEGRIQGNNSGAHPNNSWPWRVGMVVEAPELAHAISEALTEINAISVCSASPGATAFETANLIEHHRPDVLLVELARVPGSPAEWIQTIRGGNDLPLIIAVNPQPDPSQMIEALRAGASEFLFLPLRPAIFDSMDRIASLLESRQRAAAEPGRLLAFVGAKGGAGATTVACHLASALRNLPTAGGNSLVLDFDYQTTGARRIFRSPAAGRAFDAVQSVRRLNSNVWPEFATNVAEGVDLLSGEPGKSWEGIEPWRIESLMRFAVRQYKWVVADLGRHLNPANWTFLENIQELFVVTMPDVLALYKTRTLLEMLTSRGFEKSRIRLLLNRNQTAPQDFWIESIHQMFEIPVFAVIPGDYPALSSMPAGHYEYPSKSPVGKSIQKLASRLAGVEDNGAKKSRFRLL